MGQILAEPLLPHIVRPYVWSYIISFIEFEIFGLSKLDTLLKIIILKRWNWRGVVNLKSIRLLVINFCKLIRILDSKNIIYFNWPITFISTFIYRTLFCLLLKSTMKFQNRSYTISNNYLRSIITINATYIKQHENFMDMYIPKSKQFF